MGLANCALGGFIRPISLRTFRAFHIIICRDAVPSPHPSFTNAALDAISRTANYGVSLFLLCFGSFFGRTHFPVAVYASRMMVEKYG